jgi:hypothetical protein
MFWGWFLKYSSFFITGAISLAVGYALNRAATRRQDLIYYISLPQWVALVPPRQQPQQPPQQQIQVPGPPMHIGSFTLYLWNQGKAPATEVHVGHYFLPAHSVWPDVPREEIVLPGGGTALKFPVVPPKTLFSIVYLLNNPLTIEQVISYVGSAEGAAKRIPVMLQRIFPKWVILISQILWLAGLWVAINVAMTLIRYLWLIFYR